MPWFWSNLIVDDIFWIVVIFVADHKHLMNAVEPSLNVGYRRQIPSKRKWFRSVCLSQKCKLPQTRIYLYASNSLDSLALLGPLSCLLSSNLDDAPKRCNLDPVKQFVDEYVEKIKNPFVAASPLPMFLAP